MRFLIRGMLDMPFRGRRGRPALYSVHCSSLTLLYSLLSVGTLSVSG